MGAGLAPDSRAFYSFIYSTEANSAFVSLPRGAFAFYVCPSAEFRYEGARPSGSAQKKLKELKRQLPDESSNPLFFLILGCEDVQREIKLFLCTFSVERRKRELTYNRG